MIDASPPPSCGLLPSAFGVDMQDSCSVFKMKGLVLTDESGSLFLHQRTFCYVDLSALRGSASKGQLSLFL